MSRARQLDEQGTAIRTNSRLRCSSASCPARHGQFQGPFFGQGEGRGFDAAEQKALIVDGRRLLEAWVGNGRVRRHCAGR